jgi:hypothetical protein
MCWLGGSSAKIFGVRCSLTYVFLFFPFPLFPLVFPFWVFSALLVLADLFSPFGFRRALYVVWVCFAWFYFLLEPFLFSNLNLLCC